MIIVKFNNVIDFLSPKVAVSVFVTMILAILLGATEYLFALSLEHFFSSLGVIEKSKSAINILGINFNLGSLGSVYLFTIGVISIRALAHLGSSQGSEYTRCFLVFRLRSLLIEKIIWEKYEKRLRLDQIGNYLGEIFPKAGEATLSLSKSMVLSFECLVLIIGMYLNANSLALLCILSVILIGVFAKFINSQILKYSRSLPSLNEKVVNQVNQYAQNRILLQIYGIQEGEKKIFKKLNSKYLRHNLKAFFARYTLVSFLPVIGLTSLLTIIYFFSSELQLNGDSSLFAFMILYVRFIQTLSGAVNFLGAFSNYYPQLKLAYDFVQSRDKVIPSGERMQPPINELVAPGVAIESLAFGWSGKELSKNISVNLYPKEILGIIGKSGSGKSTLLSVIFGILEPIRGTVRIGGMDSRNWLETYASKVGYVGVNPFIINGTLRENLLYGTSLSVSDNEIWAILKKVKIDDEIKNLTLGLETQLNEFGDGLSSGQKQRLSIARALLRNPLLIVFDEATANLDEATEKKIFELIIELSGESTIIIITHRKIYQQKFHKTISLD